LKSENFAKSQFRIAEFYINQSKNGEKENPDFPFGKIVNYLQEAASMRDLWFSSFVSVTIMLS
jgi:hypothetical protein